jgi:putative PIN family toxin of toxin-antitoxin system
MPKAVFDTTVLVAAFLNPRAGGPSHNLLTHVESGVVELILSDDILDETGDVLHARAHLRKRYRYSDDDVIAYCRGLSRLAAEILSKVPSVRVVRDPTDNIILACAIAAKAPYLITHHSRSTVERLFSSPSNFWAY